MAKKKQTPPSDEAETLQLQIDKYEELFGEVAQFITLIARQESEIAEKQQVVYATKEKFERAKGELQEARDARDGTKHALFMFLKPGPAEILPLFDRMEVADEKKHGKAATQWRTEPITALRLSLVTASLLADAGVMFVGQLQDRTQAEPEKWWEQIEGLTAPVALAIADKLNDFIKEHTGE